MSGQKIDFVIIWVDGNDPAWRAQKKSYSPAASSDDGENRYREWDNLRYWFRGVEKYAPWVHKVHFVTCGHLPAWLNTLNPKLHLVRHSDYMPEAYLPTFSSHVIELNMNRIRGLSEQFVYFNDDMFLTRPVKPSDFFVGGLPCMGCGFEVINYHYDPVFFQVMINMTRIVNDTFDVPAFIRKNRDKIFNLRYDKKFLLKSVLLYPWAKGFIPGFNNPHLPVPYLKSVCDEVWAQKGDVLDATSRRRFRDSRDVNQYIFQYWHFMEGKFHPTNMKQYGQYYFVGKENRECLKAIRTQKHKMVCVNDDLTDISAKEFAVYKKRLIRAFDSILPEKSSFEIS